jgi:pimeloyl-ACP methyl ester carboxylesterase
MNKEREAMTSISGTHTGTERPTESRKQGCLFYIRRGLLVIFLLPFVLIAVGFVYETIMQAGDAQRYPPPGQLVDVNGYAMHIHCVGEGSPTAILESGSGGFSVQHAALQNQLRENTRVCAYDRAGMGWSESRPETRTAFQVAYELHTLLENASIEPPYVLVGPSLGGLFVRAFAAEYPDEAAGLVLLDPTHEGDLADSQGIPAGMYIFFGRIGTFRLFSAAMCPACSPEGAAAMGASRGRATPWETSQAEWQALQAPDEIETMSERLGEPGTLGDSLLVVIAANQSGVPLDEAEAAYRIGLEEEQDAMSLLSTNYRYTIVMSDHGLSDQADLVQESILDVIESARTGASLTAEV